MKAIIPPELNDYFIPWPLPVEVENKNFFETTHRVCSPEESWARWAPFKEKAGITRLTDITPLDCVGIPTYMAVRPLVDCYHQNISVYNGKGLTKMQAKVSALMEAFERFSAERHQRPTLLADLNEIRRLGRAVDPRDLNLPEGDVYDPHEKLEWVVGLELFSVEPRFVPACAAFFPYSSEEGARFFNGFPNTNGLASGNTLGEAISQGLAEVIERDAMTLAELSEKAVTIDLGSISSSLIKSLIEKFRAAKLDLILKEITSGVGVPAFFATADEPATENPVLLCGGFGAHVNAEIAAMRAITEVAQSRCTQISGSREDMINEEYKKNYNYHALKAKMRFWYERTPPLKDFGRIPLRANPTLIQDIETMLQGLQKNVREVIVVNLTMPEVEVPVVRVIVPGFEHSIDSARPGPRAKALLRKITPSQPVF